MLLNIFYNNFGVVDPLFIYEMVDLINIKFVKIKFGVVHYFMSKKRMKNTNLDTNLTVQVVVVLTYST